MTDDEAQPFGVIRLRGGRYEQRGLPLEAASELHRYEKLIIHVARELFMRQHPRRQRAPRGFSTSVILRLTAVEEGSVSPVLLRDDAVTRGSLFNLVDYFDEARLLITETLDSLNTANKLDVRFPATCIRELVTFGRSLKPDESIEFSEKDSSHKPVVLGVETRKRLQAIAQLERIEIEATVQGQVTGLRSDPQQFDFVLAGTSKRIGGGYTDPQRLEELRPFLGVIDRAPMVSLSVISEQSLDGEILAITDVLHVEAALPTEWAERIQALSELDDGWLHDESIAPTDAALEKAEQVLLACVDEQVRRPGIFPAEDGGVHLEWVKDRSEAEVVIKADGTVNALWLSKENDDEREYSYASDSPVDDIVTFIQEAEDE